MKEDTYTEIYLWNRNVDRLVRVLQRIELLTIFPKRHIKAYEVRLEEIRAALNADFSAAVEKREREDHNRLSRQRKAWEEREDEQGERRPS